MRKNNRGSDSSTVVVVKDADDVDGTVGDRGTVEATGPRAIPDWTTNADTDRASRGRASNF